VPLKTSQYSSLDFVKYHDEHYFELLRLARITVRDENGEDSAVAQKTAIALFNKLPLFNKAHKRILPLLNHKAHTLAIFDELSVKTQQLLTAATQQGIVTELARTMQLNHIIEKLAEHNIPLILLKGAAFAGVLYSPQAPRTSNDLDILIQTQYWQQAVAIIEQIMDYTAKSQPDVFGDLYELSFTPKNKVGALLDLHSSLINPLLFNINEQQLWDCSVEHPSFNNKLVRMLSPEHALIHQALHAYKDMDFSKYNLVDSHEIISTQKPDIQKTITIAKEWGAHGALFVLLKNCIEVMGTELDSDGDLLKQMQPLEKITPNPVIYMLMVKLLKSRFTQPISNKKPLRYRVNQLLAQFFFSGSVVRPLALQWLYVKSKLTIVKNINE